MKYIIFAQQFIPMLFRLFIFLFKYPYPTAMFKHGYENITLQKPTKYIKNLEKIQTYLSPTYICIHTRIRVTKIYSI